MGQNWTVPSLCLSFSLSFCRKDIKFRNSNLIEYLFITVRSPSDRRRFNFESSLSNNTCDRFIGHFPGPPLVNNALKIFQIFQIIQISKEINIKSSKLRVILIVNRPRFSIRSALRPRIFYQQCSFQAHERESLVIPNFREHQPGGIFDQGLLGKQTSLGQTVTKS